LFTLVTSLKSYSQISKAEIMAGFNVFDVFQCDK
jgi:hypothetical protein